MKEDMGDSWTRHLVRRRYVWKTTWNLRIGILLLVAAILFPSRTHWLTWLGRSLVHDDVPMSSDAIVLENYDTNYLVFETAARLMRDGQSDLLLVPTPIFNNPSTPNEVSKGIVEVMTRVAWINNAELIPVEHLEPISLSVATQVSKVLQEQGVRSVIVVTPTFRSQRSFEVYRSVWAPLGIQVCCVAARGSRTPKNWWHSTHGIKMVFLEFIKLHYYRLFVLR